MSDPVRVDYFRLNPNCGYCRGPATSIRVTCVGEEVPRVMTLCGECQKGEEVAIREGKAGPFGAIVRVNS